MHNVEMPLESGTAGRDRLVFPLDVPTVTAAVRFVELLHGSVGVFKVGLELFLAQGPGILHAVRAAGGERIFLDVKLHDIPATVRGAAAAAAGHGVEFLTVHAGGGEKMLEAAAAGAGTGVKVLAVTVLTSLGSRDLAALGFREALTDPSRLVLAWAAAAREAGCAGIVCAGAEVKRIREAFGDSLLLVVPGVRPRWAAVAGDDQARVTTPGEARRRGADLVVVGRPIRVAEDPAGAAARVAAELDEADGGGSAPPA